MSDRQDKQSNEQRLSDTYRDIARERPSADLDARILKAARDATTPRQARVRSWTRPLAWAATIGLSLAIVLQVTEQPVLEIPAEVQPATTAAPEAGPKPEPAAVPAPAPAPAKRQDWDITKGTAKKSAASDALSESVQSEDVQDAFTADMEMLREAEDMGRMRSSRSQLGAEPEAAALELAADARPEFCNETARASAESWLACIARLEDEQNHEAARLEQAAFDAVFGEPEQP